MTSPIEAVTDAIQERIANPKKPYARRLANLLVANAMHTPLQRLVPLEDAIDMVREGLRDYVRSDSSLEAFNRVIDQQLELLKAHDKPLADVLPAELVKALRQRARKPWSPGSKSLLKALDHKPVRDFIARIIVTAVVDFATANRGRARKGIDSIVGGDIGDRLQAKAEEFAQKGVSGVLHFIVDELSDPKRASQQAALREAVVIGVLSIEADNLAEELDKLDLSGTAELFRKAFGSWLDTEDGERVFEVWVKSLLEPQWQRKLGDILKENGLERVAKAHLPNIVESRVRAFAESEEFRKFMYDVATE